MWNRKQLCDRKNELELINSLIKVIAHKFSSVAISFHQATRFKNVEAHANVYLLSSHLLPPRAWLKREKFLFFLQDIFRYVITAVFYSILGPLSHSAIVIHNLPFAIFTSFNISIYSFFTLISCCYCRTSMKGSVSLQRDEWGQRNNLERKIFQGDVMDFFLRWIKRQLTKRF